VHFRICNSHFYRKNPSSVHFKIWNANFLLPQKSELHISIYTRRISRPGDSKTKNRPGTHRKTLRTPRNTPWSDEPDPRNTLRQTGKRIAKPNSPYKFIDESVNIFHLNQAGKLKTEVESDWRSNSRNLTTSEDLKKVGSFFYTNTYQPFCLKFSWKSLFWSQETKKQN